jgi:hypothetical protein
VAAKPMVAWLRSWTNLMAHNNIVLIPASRRTTLAPEAAQGCTQLLAQTIEFLDKQIERAKELLGADRAHLFLCAIDAHVVDKLDASVQLQGNQS